MLPLCRSISPSARLQHQNSYCDIDTQGNKALVMKQYLSDDQVKSVLIKETIRVCVRSVSSFFVSSSHFTSKIIDKKDR